MKIGEGEMDVPLPGDVATLVPEILMEGAQGHSVSVSPEEEELPTSEAAELFNVSYPHLVKLLEEGAPFVR